ncbi:metallophosphoesterase family protein [uncultured Flavobacterium sp.]|uniref:metallophosphoesterase family protein n=1 Tax=uncultured Flavobacterium sp. TaxID=165435 RepID=UPI0030ED57D8|tara:strand:+ start:39059 stop:39787 length:729 start_codon:yes stop_codon:yes gene_type:complete
MNRKLVIGDIHGGLKALKQVLERADVTQNDTLIFLGDYVDGWSESPEVLDFLIVLNQQQKCHFIRGNHDDLLLNYLKTNTYKEEWFLHGGRSTVEGYEAIDSTTKQIHVNFLEALEPYYLDDKNRLFIHAGFTNLKGIEFEFFKPLFYWDRTLWEMALALDENIPFNSDLYPSRLKLYKEIYIGHTPTTKINQTIPINKACVWNIDTGAAFTGPLTILDVDSKEFWQSESLVDLYTNENGRN